MDVVITVEKRGVGIECFGPPGWRGARGVLLSVLVVLFCQSRGVRIERSSHAMLVVDMYLFFFCGGKAGKVMG